jgi:putative transposase
MTQDPPHASSLRKGRFSSPGSLYFVTSNVVDRQPLLSEGTREMIVASLKWSRDDGRLWLLGYVVMDNHFHALFVLRQSNNLDKVMNSLKHHTARQLNTQLRRVGQVWQRGYHDHVIRDEHDFWFHVRYIHENPVRRGWVTNCHEYPWSTAHVAHRHEVDWHVIGYE